MFTTRRILTGGVLRHNEGVKWAENVNIKILKLLASKRLLVFLTRIMSSTTYSFIFDPLRDLWRLKEC